MRLILCADDYGMTHGVSRGILGLAEAGRLSALSCMTNMPAWAEWAPRIVPCRGRVGIGLHLNLTTGRPLGPMPGLSPQGTLPTFRDLATRALSRRTEITEIAGEITRQIDAFTEVMGGLPDFVDGHQHVHVLPGIRQALFEVLASRGLGHSGLWLRDPADSFRAITERGIAVPKAMIIASLARGFRDMAVRHGFRTNQGFAGVSPFDPRRDFGADMERFLVRPGPAHLVMCHPGEVDDDLRALDRVLDTRPVEAAYLASERFETLLQHEGISLQPAP